MFLISVRYWFILNQWYRFLNSVFHAGQIKHYTMCAWAVWASGKYTLKTKQFQGDHIPAANSLALNLFKMNSLCLPNWKCCVSRYSFSERRKRWISLVTSPNKFLSQPFIDCPSYISPIEICSSWIWLLFWVVLTNNLAGLYFHSITALIVLCLLWGKISGGK